MTGALAFLRRHIRVVNIIGGILLVIVGILMVSGIWQYVMTQLGSAVNNGFVPAI